MMRTGDGVISPAMFKNSVHNTAAGVFSIAAKNKGFTTALAAGDHTLGASLFEAYGLLATGEKEVVIALADEQLPEPLLSQIDDGTFSTLGVSFALSFDRGSNAQAKIHSLSPAEFGTTLTVVDDLQHNPIGVALALLEQIHSQSCGKVCLSTNPAQAWSLELESP